MPPDDGMPPHGGTTPEDGMPPEDGTEAVRKAVEDAEDVSLDQLRSAKLEHRPAADDGEIKAHPNSSTTASEV